MRRIVSILLAACLTMSLLPAAALAEEPDAAQQAAPAGAAQTWAEAVAQAPSGYEEIEGGRISISSAEGLAWLAKQVNESHRTFDGQTVTLAANIDLSAYEWVPIGTDEAPFKGTLDGGNHTITGMRIALSEDSTLAGLFGRISNAQLNNIQLAGASVTGAVSGAQALYIGGLAAANQNLSSSAENRIGVSGCSAELSVEVETSGQTELYIGGVLGYVEDWSGSCATIEGTDASLTVKQTAAPDFYCTHIGAAIGDVHNSKSTTTVSSGTFTLDVTMDGSGFENGSSSGIRIGGAVGSTVTTGSTSDPPVVLLENISCSTTADFTQAENALNLILCDTEIGGFFGRASFSTIKGSYADIALEAGKENGYFGNLAGYWADTRGSQWETVYTYAVQAGKQCTRPVHTMASWASAKDVYYIVPNVLKAQQEGAPFTYSTYSGENYAVTPEINDGFQYSDGDTTDGITVTPGTASGTVVVSSAAPACPISGELDAIQFTLPVEVRDADAPDNYQITIEVEGGTSSYPYGSITTNPEAQAQGGSTVTVTAEPSYEKLYILDGIEAYETGTQAPVTLTKTSTGTMGEQTYTFTMPEADVTIHGVFRTTAARIEVTPAEIDFGTASPGYAQPEAKTVVIRNSGEREKDVTLSTSSSFFNITPVGTWGNFGSSQTIKKVTLSPGAEASFTVQPKTGLPASEYKYTYTANIATNPTVRFQAVFQVQEKYVSGFSVIHQPKLQYTDGETLDLSELQVQITYNNGDTETLSYNAAGLSFSIDGTAVTHNETTVTSSAAGKPIAVHYGSFTANTDPLGVTDPRYSITVSPAVLDFGSAQPGYSRPAAQAVTVTNSGNRPVTIQMPSLAGYAIAAGGDWQNGTLPVGGSLTLTIQPNGGLGVGTYDKTLTITGENGASAAVRLQFSVHAASDPGGGESDPYLRFDSNGGTDFAPIDGHGSSFSINPYEDEDYGTHIPSRPGYRFTGWYRDSRLARRVDEGETLRVTGSMTLFAGWEEMTVPALLNGDDHYAYIQGYADGTVRPNASITRAQVATIFFRLLDEDVREEYLTTSNRFPDVDEDYWANTAISTMAALGVINGRNNGTFDPGAYITRAEFAAICSRFDDSGVTGVSTLTDISGHWAEEEIRRAAALGWIHGFSDGTFRPDESITRAQAVTMINRVLCRQPEEAGDLLPGMNTWTDCRADDWFYLAIQEAGNSHDYRPKDETYESWTALHDTPDWSRYE